MLILCCLLALNSRAEALPGEVYKVLPQFLDKLGQASLSPSLYDRDAYQALLRRSPEKRSGLRFAVQWKARLPETEPLKLRLELRGVPVHDRLTTATRELAVRQHGRFSHWAYVILNEEDYKKLGEVTAWRVTLWDGEKLLGEQKSFLW